MISPWGYTVALLLTAGQAAGGIIPEALYSVIEGQNVTNPFHAYEVNSVNQVYTRDSKVALRILPFGASIVFGVGSKDGNGYVLYLVQCT